MRKLTAARKEHLAHAASTSTQQALDVLYLLTNDASPWLSEPQSALRKNGWTTVATSRDLALDADQRDVSMAVDMEIARRAAVFVGNGVRFCCSAFDSCD